MKIYFIILLLIISTGLNATVKISYYEDKSQKLSIGQVISLKKAFSPVAKTNFGFTDAAIWLKVVVCNNTTVQEQQVLVFRDVRLDSVEVYDDQGKLLWHMGDMFPFVDRYYHDPAVAIPLAVEPHDSKTYYLRFKNWTRMNLEYQIWNESDYLNHIEKANNFEMFFFGAVLVMFIPPQIVKTTFSKI